MGPTGDLLSMWEALAGLTKMGKRRRICRGCNRDQRQHGRRSYLPASSVQSQKCRRNSMLFAHHASNLDANPAIPQCSYPFRAKSGTGFVIAIGATPPLPIQQLRIQATRHFRSVQSANGLVFNNQELSQPEACSSSRRHEAFSDCPKSQAKISRKP